MAPTNHIVPKKQEKEKGFSNIVNSPLWRGMIEKSVGDRQTAAALVSTLISVVNATPRLQLATPASIISAALRGEVGMGLSVALGEYSIVPYRSGKKDDTGNDIYIAQFQLGTNGLKRICVRSGEYRKIKLREIREGAFGGYDYDGEPIILWENNNDPDKPIVGYYGMYELRGGFRQSIYWTHEQILKHADRYSPAFSLKKYHSLLNGEIKGWDADKLRSGSSWYAEPEDLAHQKMCLKTIAKQLLNDGLAPKEVVRAIRTDDEEERNPGSVIPEDQPIFPDVLPPASSEFASENKPSEAAPSPSDDRKAEECDDTGKKKKARGGAKTGAVAEELPDVSDSDYTDIYPDEVDAVQGFFS